MYITVKLIQVDHGTFYDLFPFLKIGTESTFFTMMTTISFVDESHCNKKFSEESCIEMIPHTFRDSGGFLKTGDGPTLPSGRPAAAVLPFIGDCDGGG